MKHEKDILTSPRITELHRARRAYIVRLIILFFILSLTVITALAYFSTNHRIVINKIKVTGTEIINESDIGDSVSNDIAGRYLHLFARANSFIYPHKKIYNDLLSKFPRIEKLVVYREGLNTLYIDISERSGSYLYCGASVPEASNDVGENCYFINNDAYIFDKAPYFSGNVYFKYYIPLEDNSLSPLGKQMMPSARFHELERLVDGITSLSFKPIYIVIGADGIDYIYLQHNPSDTSPQIIFKDTDDLSTILDNLTSAASKHEFMDEIKAKYTSLLYIDLRFNNKVLYKFQGE